MNTESKIIISDELLEDYKKTAVKWQKELLELPIRQAQDVLKHMRGVTGLRGKMHFPSIEAKAEFGPYNPDRKSAATANIDWRTLETFFGNDVEVFSPNDYALLTMGYNAPTLGEGMKRAPQTLLILSQIAKARGEALANAIFTGVRNENGDKTVDLFDGFNTITAAEIEAGTISKAKGNLYEITEELTALNTCDILKDMVYSRDPFLRQTQSILLCAPEVADRYNDSYLQTHAATPYNEKFDQTFIEGSGRKFSLVALPELAGSEYMYLNPGSNMLWGTDNVSDQSNVDIMRADHYRLSFAANIFFGVNFHSIDKRRLTVIKYTPNA